MADNDVNQNRRLPRGALPTPRSELAAAMPHVPDSTIAVPPSFLMWPIEMSYWDNEHYGDCVSAEEAFAKATAKTAAAPQTFIPQDVVVAWAKYHGYLNGAYLPPVMTTMQTQGFPLNLPVPPPAGPRFIATVLTFRSTGPIPRFCRVPSSATGR